MIRTDWNEPIYAILAANNAARMGHPNSMLLSRINNDL